MEIRPIRSEADHAEALTEIDRLWGAPLGTLHISADGSYSYYVNAADVAVQQLNAGGTLSDTFSYTNTVRILIIMLLNVN